jgi:hypothetical protein
VSKELDGHVWLCERDHDTVLQLECWDVHAPTRPILNSSTNARFHPTMPAHPAIRGMDVHFACQVPIWAGVLCRCVQKNTCWDAFW